MADLDQDPFAWPYKDVKPETYHIKPSDEVFPDSNFINSTTTDSQNRKFLDDLFKTFSQEEMTSTTTNSTTSETTTDATIIETLETTLASEMPEVVTENQTEKILETVKEDFVGITRGMKDKSMFPPSIDTTTKFIENTTTSSTESLVFETTTTVTTTGLSDIKSETPIFGLDTAVNINSVKFPIRTEQETTVKNSIKELLNSMRTTKVDESLLEPIHNPVTVSNDGLPVFRPGIVSEQPIFTESAKTESAININMNINSTINTNIEDIINSTTQETITTNITQQTENNTSIASEIIPTVDEFTTEITFSVEELTSEISSAVDELTSEFSTSAREITNEITTAISGITNETTTAINDITNTTTTVINTVTNEINNTINQTKISASEITTPRNNFTAATSEIIKNFTSEPEVTTHNILKNITSTASPDKDDSNWIFYITLVVTIVILLLVIGGVFLFYKRVKGGKESGYQVSQMKEYSSSTFSENDTCNVKV